MDLDKLLKLPKSERRKFLKIYEELDLVAQRKEFAAPGGLLKFIRTLAWHVLEPDTPFQEGWALEAMCLHLEAVARGEITRLLINISPGAAKSIITSALFPVWVWAALERPGERFLCMSYAASLPERDNRRKLLLINSPEFQRLYGHLFKLTKAGEELIENDRTGFCQAAGVQSVTGRRGSVVIYDDPNNVADIESEAIRATTSIRFKEAASNRLNDLTKSAIIVIQQRSHEDDVSGTILTDEMPYVHLCIPALFEADRVCETYIGDKLFWRDPRTKEGECFWPERYPPAAIKEEMAKGPYYWAGQFQQSPEPRGGGILKREFWMPWEEKEYPKCDGADGWIIASLDGAFTAKQKNDASGLTVWGCFTTSEGNRAVILLHAARLRKDLCGPDIPKEPGESYREWRLRTQHTWGLVETVHDICFRFRVKALYIENKGPGLSVIQVMDRELRRSQYRYAIHAFDPGRLDKGARAIRVQPVFAAGQVFVPYKDGEPRAWAVPVIDECAQAPTGRKDDLLDSATAAIWILKTQGFLDHREEIFMRKEDFMRNYRQMKPLYNI